MKPRPDGRQDQIAGVNYRATLSPATDAGPAPLVFRQQNDVPLTARVSYSC